MKIFCGIWLLVFSLATSAAFAQVRQVDPVVLTKPDLGGRVTKVEVAARFVTTIRLPEAVNSVVLGDPSEFQVEHSEREPKLVFLKAISTKPAETNLLISTITGREVSLLLVSRGEDPSVERARVDFIVDYVPPGDFLVAPSGFPFAMVGETVPLAGTGQASDDATQRRPRPAGQDEEPRGNRESSELDRLLEQQQTAPLPVMYGEHVRYESSQGDRVRAGVGRVIDGGQQVIVLFSVVNPTKRAILLMPPQIQLAGRTTTGKLIRHRKWLTAEQLPVLEYRLSPHRLGPGERADGAAVFERPPYKQSNEMLLLQVAESGAVDRPALAPIGFGVSTSEEAWNGRGK